MTSPSHFDFIIIGNGLAGLQLALKLTSETCFDQKTIALIDPSDKSENDKTWSFWDEKPSAWHGITYKSWSKATIITNKRTTNLNLKPYTYKTIRAIDFYTQAKAQLNQKETVTFILENVTSVIEKNDVIVTTNKATYTASHVFDSRIPKDFTSENDNSISIIQHFKGWVIKTESDVFDDNEITMMDYRLKDGNQTTFTYVLPFSKREALVEFTYFTANTVEQSTYDTFIKSYIKEYLNINSYSIIETEAGQIPMTNYNFSKCNTSKITKIGTGGGWVKGSTGYSFKHTEKKVALIIENLKANKIPSQQLFRRKYKFYDTIFLKVLKDDNHKGEWIFENFYSKNSVQTMFRFLDEESSFKEELSIMLSLFSWTFIKAFFKTFTIHKKK
ncbi:lycopene cyclase family protein [Psychroserpens damuponensis]|uniref:lycopene cyclase family protein n=1 Tax=Psychroserpens damuponensis TaxID=943936 RepID=UPI00058B484A|nr:lycopene cyclase family protein [Psychroserpens damuponensis]